MGLLNSLLGTAISAMVGGNKGGQNQAMQLVMQLIQQNGGNLGQLLQQLQQGGLADALQSWIGTGANEEVSSTQVENALGGSLFQAAEKLGISSSDAGNLLAQYLPKIVDTLTPNGTAADADGFGLDDVARLLMQNFLKK